MKRYMLVGFWIACFAMARTANGQQAEGSYLISTAVDLARTDLEGLFQRFQFAGELNYFYLHNLSFSGGYEYNVNQPNQVSGGIRFYPLEPLFIRARGLMGNNADIALGFGYSYNITYRFRLEGMFDYYVQQKALGLRLGMALLIN